MTDREADAIARTFLTHFADKLTEGEAGFLRDTRQQIATQHPLTDTQRARVEAVADRCQRRPEPKEGRWR